MKADWKNKLNGKERKVVALVANFKICKICKGFKTHR